MKNADMSLTGLIKPLRGIVAKVMSYKGFMLFLVVAALYGFIIWRINTYSNVAPAAEADQQIQTTPQPHIDQATIQKIQSLQDNSVSVQTLFDQARDNPFQE